MARVYRASVEACHLLAVEAWRRLGEAAPPWPPEAGMFSNPAVAEEALRLLPRLRLPEGTRSALRRILSTVDERVEAARGELRWLAGELGAYLRGEREPDWGWIASLAPVSAARSWLLVEPGRGLPGFYRARVNGEPSALSALALLRSAAGGPLAWGRGGGLGLAAALAAEQAFTGRRAAAEALEPLKRALEARGFAGVSLGDVHPEFRPAGGGGRELHARAWFWASHPDFRDAWVTVAVDASERGGVEVSLSAYGRGWAAGGGSASLASPAPEPAEIARAAARLLPRLRRSAKLALAVAGALLPGPLRPLPAAAPPGEGLEVRGVLKPEDAAGGLVFEFGFRGEARGGGWRLEGALEARGRAVRSRELGWAMDAVRGLLGAGWELVEEHWRERRSPPGTFTYRARLRVSAERPEELLRAARALAALRRVGAGVRRAGRMAGEAY